MNYREKYLKYKSKYLLLKSNMNLNQFGGDKPLINDIDGINLFTIPRMEEHLNPIYGLILCNIGRIPNNYYLYKSKFINTNESKFIFEICRKNGNTIRPNNKISDEIKPYDYGFYAGIKYIHKFYKNKNFIVVSNSGKIKFLPSFSMDDKTILTESINKINKYIGIKNDDKFYFHMLLFCLWWYADNDDGIRQYYDGINRVFCIFNKYFKSNEQLPYCIKKSNINNSFEKIVYDLCENKFKIYNLEQTKNFCQNSSQTYPDCGETTARNLINLICFDNDTKKFSTDILNKFCAIPELIEYYTKFNNFDVQSSNEKIFFINMELNARDAWSKLVIECGNANVKFVKSCKSKDIFTDHHYELDEGLSNDGKNSNFLQLITNLLPMIKKFTDIKIDSITDIKDETINGIGDIIIEHKLYNTIKIHCQKKHYYMEIYLNNGITNKMADNNDLDLSKFSEQQQNFIENLLKKNINKTNYIDILFDEDLLIDNLDDDNVEIELKNKLFSLSLTEQYNSDTRMVIKINTINLDLFDKALCIYDNYLKNNSETAVKIDEYKFLFRDNFEFVKKIPKLRHLNCTLKYKNITSIDLKPLMNITSIGDNFLYICPNLVSIDLSPLSNITTIGSNFLFNCGVLKEIDFGALKNVITIKDGFLHNCTGLEKIDMSSFKKLITIGDNFLYYCKKLTSIDLSSFENLTSIGDNFLFMDYELTSIDLSPLKNLTEIGNNFLQDCTRLTSINLSSLTKISLIGNNFLSNCKNITSIDLSSLSDIKSFGYSFLSNCRNIKTIICTQVQKDILLINNSDLANKITLV